ncbi:hypothetical protein JL720_4201 [Aureococcus anophagefferens]|nr:hypothetical protein JL720_4201 [Aureococcus anophagefferens]
MAGLLRAAAAAGVAGGACLLAKTTVSQSHCMVPCGIFDDPRVVSELKQDAATIKKAMVQITALAGSRVPQDVNQCTRWVMTKEDHANKIIKTTAEYMLAQRVKAPAFASRADYAEAVIAHHALLQAAMKAKQTVDVAHCDALDHAIDDVGAISPPAHRHVDEGAVLAEMSTAPPFPHKAPAAVVAHCGRDRLGSGAAWADHCAFRGVDISPVVRADEGAADEKHRYYARYSAGLQNSADFFNASSRAWCTAPREASIRPNTRAATTSVSNSRPGPVDEPAGVVEPLHVNFKADLEWVVLSGKFKVEAGPVNPVPGHPKVADTLVAGSCCPRCGARAAAAAPVASQSRQLRQLGDFLGSGPRDAAPSRSARAPQSAPPTPEAVEPAGRDAGSDATFRSALGKPRRRGAREASLDRERDAVVDLTDSPLDTQTEAAVAAAEARRGSAAAAGAIAAAEAVVVVDLGGGLCCLRVGGVEKHASARGRSEHFKVASGYGPSRGWEAFRGGPRRRRRAPRPRRRRPAPRRAAAAEAGLLRRQGAPRRAGAGGRRRLGVATRRRRRAAVVLDPAVSDRLRDHQRAGVAFLLERARGAGAGGGPPPIRGAILADGMGLGKAAMALSAVHGLLQQGGARKAAVLCPASVLDGWKKEIAKLMPKCMRPVVLRQSEYEYPGAVKRQLREFLECPAAHVLLCSHDAARGHAAALLPVLDVVVVDEAHAYKNPKTASYRALDEHLPRACARLLLTGTPAQNDLGELRALVALAAGDAGDATLWRGAAKEGATEADGAALRRFVAPAVLRRDAREALARSLPPLEDRRGAASSNRQRHALGAAGALRLLCCHPALWDRGEAAGDALEPSIVEAAAALLPARDDEPGREYGAGAKVAFLRAALPALAARGERVVVASGYVSALRLVARLLRDLGLSHCRVDGSASADAARAVGAFAAGAAEAAAGRGEPPPPAVLLLSSRAGGAGLNLPARATADAPDARRFAGATNGGGAGAGGAANGGAGDSDDDGAATLPYGGRAPPADGWRRRRAPPADDAEARARLGDGGGGGDDDDAPVDDDPPSSPRGPSCGARRQRAAPRVPRWKRFRRRKKAAA